MKAQPKKPQKPKLISVRLPSQEHREAYEQYCKDNARSLDAQTSLLIIKELAAQGYIKPESTPMATA